MIEAVLSSGELDWSRVFAFVHASAHRAKPPVWSILAKNRIGSTAVNYIQIPRPWKIKYGNSLINRSTHK